MACDKGDMVSLEATHVSVVGDGSLCTMWKEKLICFGSPLHLRGNAQFLEPMKLICFGICVMIQQTIVGVPSSLDTANNCGS